MMILRLSLPVLITSFLVSMANAVPTGNGHGHNHGHTALAANGQTCNMSNQCQSQYCHRGICDVKKPNGHVCYKDAGCLSGRCKDKKCRPASGHTPSTGVPTSSTAAPTSSTVTATSSTTSVTPSHTSTTTTPQPTTKPTRNFGELVCEGKLANPGTQSGSNGESFQGFIVETGTGGIKTQSASEYNIFRIDPENMVLKSIDTGNVLTTDGLNIYAQPEDVGFNLVNGFPFVCSIQGDDVDSKYHHPVTRISCVASIFGEKYSNFYICSDDRIVASLQACSDGDSRGRRLITKLLLGDYGQR